MTQARKPEGEACARLQVHVRLRGAELQRAVECFQRTVQASNFMRLNAFCLAMLCLIIPRHPVSLLGPKARILLHRASSCGYCGQLVEAKAKAGKLYGLAKAA